MGRQRDVRRASKQASTSLEIKVKEVTIQTEDPDSRPEIKYQPVLPSAKKVEDQLSPFALPPVWPPTPSRQAPVVPPRTGVIIPGGQAFAKDLDTQL